MKAKRYTVWRFSNRLYIRRGGHSARSWRGGGVSSDDHLATREYCKLSKYFVKECRVRGLQFIYKKTLFLVPLFVRKLMRALAQFDPCLGD